MKEIYCIAAFYKFVKLDDYKKLGEKIYREAAKNSLSGTFILSKEGINATIAGSEEGISAVIEYLKCDTRFSDLEYKLSSDIKDPFYRLKVKFKKEIVPIGLKWIDPNLKVGKYVRPLKWNELLNDPDVLVIDTRNDYEYEVGTFKGAVNPNTKHFRDFPEYVNRNLDPSRNKKIAMFCTGGIRCEKATSYLMEKGFEEVYQLKGGILKYLEEIPEEKSLWEGECFVFDDRTSVNHKLEKGSYELCRNCRYPLSPEDRKSEKYRAGISCAYCFDTLTEKRVSSLEERQKQIKLAKMRNQKHLGSTIHRQKKKK